MASDLPSPPNGGLRRIVNALTIDFSPLRALRDFRLVYIGQFVNAPRHRHQPLVSSHTQDINA